MHKLIYIFLVVSFVACDPIDYKLKIYNQSDSPVYCIHSFKEELSLLDSTVAEPYNGKGITPNQHYIIMANYVTWEGEINKESPDGKLRMYIFKEDSVNKYSWKNLIEEKKYDKKYVLSISELEQINWVIQLH